MKFKAVDVTKVKNCSSYRSTKLLGVLDVFDRTDVTEVECVMEPDEYSDVYVMRATLKKAVERYGYTFQVFVRRGHVYLVKQGSPLYKI